MKILSLVLFVLFCNYNYVLTQQKLGTYKIFSDGITLSGQASGGAMASQLHVAFSKTFSGVGIVTGPPYYCAGTGGSNNALTTCMYLSGSTINVDSSASVLSTYVSKGQADDPVNLKNDKVYLYHGTVDYTVTEGVVKKNEDFYKKYLADTQIKKVYTVASSHGFITNNYGALCNVLSSPNYINNCNYNQAYDILKHLYNLQTAEPSKTALYKEKLIEFDQTEFFPSGTSTTISMDSTGYVYVPTACSSGKTCKLHIVFHGCLQGKYNIGNIFADKTGYNQVADDNDIIIIYPQAKATSVSNPNGCWDWWGYTTPDYANKSGPQMTAIKNMIDRITSGGVINGGNGNTNGTATCFKYKPKSKVIKN